MDDKNIKYENHSFLDDDHALHIFAAILFLVGVGLIMLALFIFAWACDYFGWGPSALPDGWY